ncbi:hypothetical protein HNY73_016114 [Argiope bruennichi]|uniref:Uncharacterized protein n=1 Tax=Argiope bruennichi TaxID=94029 RepID=A0A8T0EHZ2_ARGBR|nr:hypothetical protein HNY73_016114 [Argiope bruennichi]
MLFIGLRWSGNSSPDSITVRYQLSVGVSNECIDQIQAFEKYSQSAVPAYANRNEVLEEVRKYPLVDILLVDCRIWNYHRNGSISDAKSLASYLLGHSADNLPQDVLQSTTDELETLKRKLRPYPESCSAYTRIPVERWYFLWSIKRFSERSPNDPSSMRPLLDSIRKNRLTSIQNILQMDLRKAAVIVKNTNDVLSEIVFFLMAFWMTGLFYNLTKLIHRQSDFKLSNGEWQNSIFNVFIYGSLFVILVALSAEIPIIFSRIRSAVVQARSSETHYKRENSDVSLLIQILDDYSEDVTVKPFGVWKLDRSFIFVSFGIVITYELLLIQILER